MMTVSDDLETWPASELVERILALEAENTILRRQSAQQGLAPLSAQLGLTPSEARLLCALLDGVPKTRTEIYNAMYSDRAGRCPDTDIVKKMVSGLRRKIASVGMQVAWSNNGYLLSGPDITQQSRIQISSSPPNAIRAQGFRGYPGQAMSAVLSQIIARKRSSGLSRFSSKEIASAAGIKSHVSRIMRSLEKHKKIKVRQRPLKNEAGGYWLVYVRAGAE